MHHAIHVGALEDGTISVSRLAYTMSLAIEKVPFDGGTISQGEFTKAFLLLSDHVSLAYIRTTVGVRNVDILKSRCTADWSWCCVAHLLFFVSLIL